jgi:hypothetical protein
MATRTATVQKAPTGRQIHSTMLTELDRFEKEARKQNNPQLYLQLLSPLHFQWHAIPTRARRIGFLLFHWHVIEHFKALGLEAIMNAQEDTVADFTPPGGKFRMADWGAIMDGVSDSTTLTELEDYSQAIEGWHNEAHMAIGQVTGLDMMNPTVNVFFTEFWDLHYFINTRFEEQLRSYADSAHPDQNLNTPADIVRHIEKEHRRTIALI